MKDNETIHVWLDYSSTGIWVTDEEHPYIRNADYERFDLPQELIARFKYWERWFDNTYSEWSDARNKMDWKLYDAYGFSLAIDLKRFLGNKNRVVYGSPTYVDEKLTYDECTEIILAERERSETEAGKIVPMGISYDPKEAPSKP